MSGVLRKEDDQGEAEVGERAGQGLGDNCQLSTVRSDNCQIRQLSDWTTVRSDNCQIGQLSVGQLSVGHGQLSEKTVSALKKL